jgi:hypothetical protein
VVKRKTVTNLWVIGITMEDFYGMDTRAGKEPTVRMLSMYEVACKIISLLVFFSGDYERWV